MKNILFTILFVLLVTVGFSQRLKWISVADTTTLFPERLVAHKTAVYVQSETKSYFITANFGTDVSMGEVVTARGYYLLSPNEANSTLISTNTDSINQNLSEVDALQALNLGVIAPSNSTQADTTIDMTNADADLTYTAVGYGAGGNGISVTHADRGYGGVSLSVSVADLAITVFLATDDSTASVNTLGGIVYTAVTKGVLGDLISVEHLDPSGNDQPLVITVTDSLISISLETGPAGAIISTELAVKDSIDNDASASALVTCAAETGGATVATTVAETNLGSGYDGGVITSTAALIKAAVNVHVEASALVVCEDENAGAGIVNAKAEIFLSTGVDATPTAEIGAYGFKSDFSLYYIKVDLHNWRKVTISAL